jgi:hypothetical protein
VAPNAMQQNFNGYILANFKEWLIISTKINVKNLRRV